MQLIGIRNSAFLDRYALKDKTGQPIETEPEQMWRRIARAVADNEKTVKLKKEWEEKFYSAMTDFKFVPGGRILSGAGTGYKVTYYNCFVIPSPRDSRDGILETLKQMVEIMARGGGVGINLSSLRPKGARVTKVNGFSSGPCNWAELFSVATKDIIQQGGCFAPDTRIMTHRGLVPIAEIVNGKNNFFAGTHKGYKKVTARFANGIKQTFEITTASGAKVTTTAEHRFLTFNKKGEFFQAPLSDLKSGDNVVMLLGEWSDELPNVSLTKDIPKPSKYSFGLKNILLPEELTADLAFFIGVYHADGSKISDEYNSNGKGIRIAVAQDRPEDLQTITDVIYRCFGVIPKKHKGDGAVWDVEVFSRRLNEFLAKNNLLKQSSINVTVSEQIFRSPKSVVAAYIAGVFTGDGSNRGGKGGLRITTVSQKFAQQLQLLLFNLGIASQIKMQKRTVQGWRTLYTVTVNGHTFMKRFLKLLAQWTEKITDNHISIRDGVFGWPFNLVDRFLYLSNFQRTMARTNPTTSQKTALFLQQHTEFIHEEDRPDVELITTCVPDTIVSIIPKGQSEVFDLEVTDAHLLSGNGFYTSNSRRGALMLMLWDWHPDIEEFITVKQNLSKINGANLSVCISDSFMEKVKIDGDWDLYFPDNTDPEYDQKWDGIMAHWIALGKKTKVHKTIKARYLWDLICQAAWRSAEPGVVFMERYNKWHANSYFNYINCVNPCGEEGLPAWGVCNLSSINLAALVNDKGEMDYKLLSEIAKISVRFQDNIIDQDVYVFEGIRQTQLNGERRIGLGTMGLGDALIKMKIRYGSQASLEVCEKIYKTIRDSAFEASVEIAKDKGPFPKFDRQKYLEGYFIQQLPESIQNSIKKHGIRNSVLLMQAPTGTTSLLAGTSSGIEPVYEFEFLRKSRLGQHILRHQLYEIWYEQFKKANEAEPAKEDRPEYFVSANDLTPEDHVKVQAVIQKYVDASISKTVNAPAVHSVEDVKRLYTLAYDLGCKGITYMREGSRTGVLERIPEQKKTEEGTVKILLPQIKPRPAMVTGATYRIETPVGKAYVTLNTNSENHNEPFEVFINIGKAGSDVQAMADSIGRLISLTLRMPSPMPAQDKVKEVIGQLSGIGGSRHIGFGERKVRSLPDAIAKIMHKHFATNGHKNIEEATNGHVSSAKINPSIQPLLQQPLQATITHKEFDLCPSCGEALLAHEEGCKKCYGCGYSEC